MDAVAIDALVRARRAGLRRRLLAWYQKNARDLPWRRTRHPYHVWLSEIMLQQTRVETVIPYFRRFIHALPGVRSLAQAPEDRVLKLWEGLGYYSRARNLQRAARLLLGQYKGKFPQSVAQWQALPGIGRYTAGAIVSIAFDTPAPILDGNVKRVLARWFNVREELSEPRVNEALWRVAELLVPRQHAGDFNQAMMELGALVCLPKNPRCEDCPTRNLCEAHHAGCQNDVPVRRRKKATPHFEVVAAIIRRRGRILIGKRPPGGLLGGLWEFPGGKIEPGETPQQALAREVREETGLQVAVGEQLAQVEHAYSHFSITLNVYRTLRVTGRAQAKYHTELRWVTGEELSDFAFPAANKKVLAMLP